MEDIRAYAERLRLSDHLRDGAVRAAIGVLALPAGSRGLDAGCGIGQYTRLLAQTVGPAGHVTGVDVSPAFVALAQEQSGKAMDGAEITYRQGDVRTLPFEDGTFDWAWSADTVYAGAVGDPEAITRELSRTVRPGGLVALAFWSDQKLLPGYPLLEARLDAGFAESAPYLAAVAPHLQFTGALGWLRRAGLEDVTARTFAADICAPLIAPLRGALAMAFDMLWSDAARPLTSDEQALLARLCTAGSSDYILDRPDYHAFVCYSVFWGRVPLALRGPERHPR